MTVHYRNSFVEYCSDSMNNVSIISKYLDQFLRLKIPNNDYIDLLLVSIYIQTDDYELIIYRVEIQDLVITESCFDEFITLEVNAFKSKAADCAFINNVTVTDISFFCW